MNGGKLGNCVSTGYSSTVFEPINEYKGDLARTYFYMTTRYYSEDGAWATSPATNKSLILQWQLDVLLAWHQQDPVSAKEIARNDSIYKVQNNRNPFIDHPNYADSIWLSPTAIGENSYFAMNVYTVYPNPASTYFTLSATTLSHDAVELNIEDVSGKTIKSFQKVAADEIKVDCAEFEAGIYFITVKEKNGISRMKLIKAN
jgi:hypothetical protein